MSAGRRQLDLVARQLGPLLTEVVFVGGHVAELLVTDPAGVRIRPTDDVDVIVAVTTRTQYQRFGEALKGRGFREDTSPNAPLCRWVNQEGQRLDVMPTTEDVLLFTNRWYQLGIETATPFKLAADLEIRVVIAPVFLGTKWAAFDSRGKGDYHGSSDLEDIITVVAGRSDLIPEIERAPSELRSWLALRTQSFLESDYAEDAIAAALPDAWFDPRVIDHVVARFQAIANLGYVRKVSRMWEAVLLAPLASFRG